MYRTHQAARIPASYSSPSSSPTRSWRSGAEPTRDGGPGPEHAEALPVLRGSKLSPVPRKLTVGIQVGGKAALARALGGDGGQPPESGSRAKGRDSGQVGGNARRGWNQRGGGGRRQQAVPRAVQRRVHVAMPDRYRGSVLALGPTMLAPASGQARDRTDHPGERPAREQPPPDTLHAARPLDRAGGRP